MRTAKRLMTFDGEFGEEVFQLPFKPIFVIADYDGDLSKASVSEQLTIREKGSYECSPALFKAEVNKVEGNDSIWLYVTHHWTRPDTSLSPRFLQLADRYWTVTGIIPDDARIGGRFYYSRSGSDRTLDEELFSNTAEFGQVRLLYREKPSDEWTVAAKMHIGGSSQGYFVMQSLKTGEYTLARIDTSYVDIAEPVVSTNGTVRIYPNPTSGSVTVETDTPGEPLAIEVCDVNGRTVVKDIRTTSGEKITLNFNNGNFLFNVKQLRNNRLSSVKVYFMNF